MGEASRALDSKYGCIHPGQIRVIHEAFQPTPLEIEKAKKVVAASKKRRARDWPS